MSKQKILISLSEESVDRLFTEYGKRVIDRNPNFSKSSIVEELILMYLPAATKHFDINNISKEEK